MRHLIKETHEKKKKRLSRGQGADAVGFSERVRTAFDVNHREFFQRIQSLTPADLESLGIDSPSLRSSFDFSVVDRFRNDDTTRRLL